MSSYSRNGALKIDGNLEGELQAAGQTKSIEVQPTFFLGNLLSETLEIGVVRNNLQVISITLQNSTSKFNFYAKSSVIPYVFHICLRMSLKASLVA